MAVNVTVYDLNFPNNPKTVTVDLTELVPLGNSGEDVWVFSASTTATASGGSSIQKLYISSVKLGWAKSSGLNSGPYNVTSIKRHLKVAIDEAIGSGVEVGLTINALPLSGEDVARDLQNAINATATPGGAKAGNLSYKNATVTYRGGTFMIVSGTASTSYTGADRSSVAVADGTTTTGLAAELGFDKPVTSETLATSAVKQTTISAPYTSGVYLTVTNGSLLTAGDCIGITDGTNSEFRGVQTVVGTTVVVASGFSNSYDSGSKVQVLGFRDASGDPPMAYTNIDDYIKYAISSIANQIHFG